MPIFPHQGRILTKCELKCIHILQDIEFFSINYMAQIMRMYTKTVGLSENGQFFRLKPTIDKISAHPWGNALLDDYELTIKMMLKNCMLII